MCLVPQNATFARASKARKARSLAVLGIPFCPLRFAPDSKPVPTPGESSLYKGRQEAVNVSSLSFEEDMKRS